MKLKINLLAAILLASIAFLLGSVGLVVADVWNATWEGRPAGTELASDLDLFITEFKIELRQRLEAEHIWGSSTDDNGLHQPGSARCFLQNAAPVSINAGVGGLEQWNSAAEADADNDLDDDEIGLVTRDIGAGRCWFDLDGPDGFVGTTDDNLLHTWNETTNLWVAVPSRDAGGAGIGASNLIYNGSFEVTDGTGIVCTPAPCTVPSGWALIATPDIAYDNPTGLSEGTGVALETIGSGAINEGVQQTLTSLKTDTDYVIRARARPVTPADTCDLQVTGGDATVTDTSAAGTNVFETLEVIVNTTAVPGALVVRLESNADTDECDWDHVTAFERNAVVPQPGTQVSSVRNTWGLAPPATLACGAAYTANCVGSANTFQTRVTIPGPGYVVTLDGNVEVTTGTGANEACQVRIHDVTNNVTLEEARISRTDIQGPDGNTFSVPLHTVVVAPAVGSTIQYDMDVRVTSGTCLVASDVVSYLHAVLIPTR